MKTQSYYRELLPQYTNGNFEINDEPLVVNCTGYWERAANDTSLFANRAHERKDYYLLYITKGGINARIAGEDIALSRGEFIIYSPHTSYYHNFNSEKMGYLWLHFTGFHARRILSSLGIKTNRIYKTDASDANLCALYTNFERLFGEMANRRFGFESVCGGILNEILVFIARNISSDGSKDERILNSVVYMHRHFRENTPLEKLASMENLSISRYRDVFKSQTGFSPTDYRTMLRLRHACELLLQTDCTMVEIALECGYTDVYYFLRIFKLKHGVTPSEYRERERTT